MATATDGQRAHDILLGFAPLSRRGACWYYVWKAYAAAGASTSMGATPTALKGWEVSHGKHPGDRNPPPGAAIWLGRRHSDGNMDGDVFIAGQHDGDHAATDFPGWNQVGRCSIQQRINQTGREYLGWTDHVCDAPIIMGGGASIQPNQRQVVSTAVSNGRAEPTSQSALVGEPLAPNTIGTFVGWVHGESVEGNNVWFKGTSGRWFWSGGYTDKGTHDLADLNAPSAGNTRTVGPNGANGRSDPSTNGGVTQTLAPGSSWPFDAWVTGQDVQGNSTWFRGANSGDWFWSGGFTDQGTHDLSNLNTPVPPNPSKERTVVPDGAKVRGVPYLTAVQVGFLDPGTVIAPSGWTHGDAVSGNDVWFHHAGGWSWSGGFTSASTEGIPEESAPPKPEPGDNVRNPRGLPEETGYQWPLAQTWLNAPLGHTKCEDPSTPYALRITAGSDKHPVHTIIDTYIIHWTDTADDDRAALDWHSYCNSRSSCPTTQINRDGYQTQFIRPKAKPAATGPDWNWRSFAVETVGGPGFDFTDAQWETHAQNLAYLHHLTVTGELLDGVPVAILLDRDHVKGHDEIPGFTVECPGAAQIAYLPTLLSRAQAIYDDVYGEDPESPALDPEKYPTLYALHLELKSAFGS